MVSQPLLLNKKTKTREFACFLYYLCCLTVLARVEGIALAVYFQFLLAPAAENIIPKEVVIEGKSTIERMQLLQQLDDEDKTTVFKIVDTMLTKKKFKNFFAKNVAML